MNNPNIRRINIFLSTLNFVLCFVGYQFVTTILLPSSSDIEGISRTVTVPYHAFALFVSLLVIMINFRKSIDKMTPALKVLLFFWLIMISRMLYDVFIRTDIHLNDTSQLWFFVFGICLPAVFSIIKSYKYIDLDQSLYWILGMTALTIVISIFSNQNMLVNSNELVERQNGNMALNCTLFGHFAVIGIILSIYVLINKSPNFVQKVSVILMILLCVFSMMRAGSRGPVVSLITVLLFWLFSRGKNLFRGMAILTFVSILIFAFLDQILDLMGEISPVIESRLRGSIYEGNTGDRDPLFLNAINAFVDSPIFGKQFAIFPSDGGFYYSHNILLDAFMGLGIIGGGMMIYFLGVALKKSYYLITNNDAHYWVCLILLEVVVGDMTSGAFYLDAILSVLLSFLFLKCHYYSYTKNNLYGHLTGDQPKKAHPILIIRRRKSNQNEINLSNTLIKRI